MSTKTASAQQRILLVAATLFSRQGIRASGVDSIVKSANTNKMTLYKHFPSKEALIVAYLQSRDAELWDRFVEQIERKDQPSKDKLLAIFDIHGEWLANPDFQGCPFINASAEFPDQNHVIHRVSAAFYRKLQNHMTDLAEQAGARSPQRLAGQLCALFQGTIVSEQLQRHSGAADDAKLAAELLIANSIE